ncbi:DnaJ chaperone [Trichodelitschia bisporula]|uniref:DnaJ chaperone n=1 Tax=Trichodelitschia bisporula TaxID=703511 RepID=A0A6G1IBX3_9PEZI|nr:DnaJ chaperone [Trichodelitschia bisporula]
MSSDPLPDYYTLLSIPPTATAAQIREAYKRAALKSHPDRVPAHSPERATRTKQFQQINDAYYTLSDATRRSDYDAARAFHEQQNSSQTGGTTGGGGFPFSSFFPFGSSNTENDAEEDSRANAQFGTAFEEMLREEGLAEGAQATPTGRFWSIVGGVSGGAMGFIVANMPGAIAGAVAGNRLGAVRDSRGKSVYSVYQELPQSEKARLLSELAAKVFAQAVAS